LQKSIGGSDPQKALPPQRNGPKGLRGVEVNGG